MNNRIKSLLALLILIGLIISCGNQQTKNPTVKEKESLKKQTPVRLEGKGDRVKTTSLNKGVAIFTMNHSGSGNFSVIIKSSSGEYLDLLANDIGSYSGQKTFTVEQDGSYLVEVTASGKWQIDIE